MTHGEHMSKPVDCPEVELLPMELHFLVRKIKSTLSSNSRFFPPHSDREFRFITDFALVKSDLEQDLDPLWTRYTVLIAKIVDLDWYQNRHGIIISDENYIRPVVLFQHQRNPRPYFKWDHLKPGKFICIQAPRSHLFLDRRTGFRVDDPDTVHILSRDGYCLSG